MPLRTLGREEVIARLRQAMEPLLRLCEPEFVVLFGSYAYGEPHGGSDVDVMVVYPDGVGEEERREGGEALHRAFGVGLEVHPWTVSKWREALLRRNWFVAEVVRRGVPLFSRRPWEAVLREVEELMEQSQNLYPLEWLERGRRDWRLMEVSLEEGWIPEAAYHLQQAVEKWLKGFLLHRGWELERTHDLEALLDEAVKHEPDLERFRALCHRAKYFIGARYPGFPFPPSEEELRRWVAEAEALGALVLQAVEGGTGNLGLEERRCEESGSS